MKIINIQLTGDDATDLDAVKKQIKAKTRPETIRFLVREWKNK